MASTAQNDLASAKKAAAEMAVLNHVKSNTVVGVGSGTTIVFGLNKIAERVNSGDLQNIICVPTSYQAEEMIINAGLRLGDLNEFYNIDVAIDGADEVDAFLNCIKGGGACHLQEKMVAYNAKTFILIGDYTKQSEQLGQTWKKGVPVSFVPKARYYLRERITLLGGNPKLRMGVAKMGPVLTDDGHFIYDVDFGTMDNDRAAFLDNQLRRIPGVVETGLFLNMAQVAYFGQADGKVLKVDKPNVSHNVITTKGTHGAKVIDSPTQSAGSTNSATEAPPVAAAVVAAAIHS